ncbi:MAG: hypothetical protein KC503_25890 [Myxococcales bacterium]|nr:hypothetical protein [Myxococcales bacterium]
MQSKGKVWIAGAVIAVVAVIAFVVWRRGPKPDAKPDGDGTAQRAPTASASGASSGQAALNVARAAARKAEGKTNTTSSTSGGGGQSVAPAPNNTASTTPKTEPVKGMGKPMSREEMAGHLERARIRVGKLDKVIARVRGKANAIQMQQIQRQRDYYAQAVQHLTQKIAELDAQKSSPASK